MESGDEGDQSDCEIKGGYDPAVRRILARAEKRGDKTWRKEDSGDDSSDESENGDSDEDPESEGFSSRAFFPATSSTRMEEDRQRAVKEVERSIEQCLSYLDKSTGFESRKTLEDQLEGLQIQKKKLKKEGSKKFDMKYVLRSRKGKKPEKMCPVVIRGQSLEYKPWQNTDMSDILEKLPTLQDGAYPWISKLEEIMYEKKGGKATGNAEGTCPNRENKVDWRMFLFTTSSSPRCCDGQFRIKEELQCATF
ncbi:hypothetical protein MHYP_G00311080 [Metynnis hypsauchen]